MQLTDTLALGGAERVAVNLANLLPRDRYRSYLCASRRDGPLTDFLAGDVHRLSLGRTHRFDMGAVRRLANFIKDQNIAILHAHASSLFLARMVSYFVPGVAVIWHDHFGRAHDEERPRWLYRAATRNIAAIISVSETLASWARNALGMPADRVSYIPNLVDLGDGGGEAPELPGRPGHRIVCVANFRPQKDQLGLLDAMTLVLARDPDAHLLLVGAAPTPEYRDAVLARISELKLGSSVSHLGPQQRIAAILRGCDIGVLSSSSEGLPLSLLEYGAAGLASVSTDVGQCGEVLDGGNAGILVPPGSPSRLSEALLQLLESEKERARYGSRLEARVQQNYGPGPIIRQICGVYERAVPQVTLRAA
jgi:glycosyltransferase involved in cell wall biosynthesis